MAELRASREQVRNSILEMVDGNPGSIARVVGGRFGLSRQIVSRHLKSLVAQGLLEATGKTRARRYVSKTLVDEMFVLPVTLGLEEDRVWRERMLPLIGQVPENVLSICNYGFTEILNNVISHSDGTRVIISLQRKGIWVAMSVQDDGVGIFEKIQTALRLNDARHALFELAKGKLTTNQRSHTGEGIFFTSRMFDKFSILSSTLFYSRERTDQDDWLIESEDRSRTLGTRVSMEIRVTAPQTRGEVFSEYESGVDDNSFSRTHVPVRLAKYEHDQLLSRSAARRVLARFEKFREVLLDFKGVDTIGQAFADEIFRVFKREHPEILVIAVRTSPDVENMIKRARANELVTV